jgi:hypothetical protein
MTLGLDQHIRVNGQQQRAGTCTRGDLFRAALELAAVQATAADRSATAMQNLLRAIHLMTGAPEDQTLQQFWDAHPPTIY